MRSLNPDREKIWVRIGDSEMLEIPRAGKYLLTPITNWPIIIFMGLNVILESSLDTPVYDPQVQVFKVLTHPARLAILNLLREGEHCVCHMEAHLGFRQAYISQQLAVLREAGLIQDRRDGWNIYYRVVEPRIFEVLDAVGRMTNPQGEPPPSISPVNCPCPTCSGSIEA